MVEVKEEDTTEMATRLAPREAISATIIRRLRTGTRRMIATQAHDKMQSNEATTIKRLADEDDVVAKMTSKTVTADIITAASLPSPAGMIALFAYRTSKTTTPSMLMQQWSVPPR